MSERTPLPSILAVNESHAQGFLKHLPKNIEVPKSDTDHRQITPELAAEIVRYFLQVKEYLALAAFFDAIVQQTRQLAAVAVIQALNVANTDIPYEPTQGGTVPDLSPDSEIARNAELTALLMENFSTAYTILIFITKIVDSIKEVRAVMARENTQEAAAITQNLNLLANLIGFSDKPGPLSIQLKALLVYFGTNQTRYPQEYQVLIATVTEFRKVLGLETGDE